MYEKQETPPCGALNSYIWNKCIGEIADAIEDIALLRVEELHLLDGRGDSAEQPHRGISKEQLACAELRSIRLERTPVIAVDADTVYFRSEVFCEFQLHAIGDAPDKEEGKFFWTSCKLTLFPDGHRLEVLQVNPMVNGEYTREPLHPLPEFPGVSANQNLLPDLSGMDDAAHKERLEKEAERFLTQYCGEALERPQAVPIRQIAEEKMGINLIVDKSLSNDLSIFGETVFVDSDVGVLTDGEREQLHCKAGTILLEPDALMVRNMGSYNFTLAHEVYHWYAHRAYMLLRMANAGQGHAKQESAVQQCYVYNNGSSRTPAALAEIQANAVAARILMPRRAVARKYKELQEKYGTAEKMMVADLAIFFEVSKQAMRIRLETLGIMANTALQPEKMRRIDRLTLFDAFSTDKNLRRLLVSGAYRYADGYSNARNVNIGYDFITDMLVLEIKLDEQKMDIHRTDNPWLTRAAQSLAEAFRLAASKELDVEFTELVTGYRIRTNAAGAFVDVYLYDSLSSGAGYAVSVADNIEKLLKQIRELLVSCDCGSACHKCLKHYRNQYVHGLLDRFAALELLEWGTSGKLAESLSVEEQHLLLLPLESILRVSGCTLVTLDNGILVKRKGRKEKKLVVYPAMWKEPQQEDTVYVSNAYIKYAKPYAVQKILSI